VAGVAFGADYADDGDAVAVGEHLLDLDVEGVAGELPALCQKREDVLVSVVVAGWRAAAWHPPADVLGEQRAYPGGVIVC
jgi:hypothetical protein